MAQVLADDARGVAIPTSPFERTPADACVVLPVRTSESRLMLAPLAANPSLSTSAGLAGADVQAARTVFSSGVGNAVVITFTAGGAMRFNKLAAATFSQQPPRGEVAVASRAPRSRTRSS